MLTVTDANGCTATATASFVVETQINQELCDGQTIDAEAETGATSYQWYKDGVAIDAANGGDQQTYTITEAGEYNYTIDGARRHLRQSNVLFNYSCGRRLSARLSN